jgi:hypothetical protein
VGGAGKKWKGKFLVLVPTLHIYHCVIFCYHCNKLGNHSSLLF